MCKCVHVNSTENDEPGSDSDISDDESMGEEVDYHQPTQAPPTSHDDAVNMLKGMLSSGVIKPDDVYEALNEHTGGVEDIDDQLRPMLTITPEEFGVFQDKLTSSIKKTAEKIIARGFHKDHDIASIYKLVAKASPKATPQQRVDVIVKKFMEFNVMSNFDTLIDSASSTAMEDFKPEDVIAMHLTRHLARVSTTSHHHDETKDDDSITEEDDENQERFHTPVSKRKKSSTSKKSGNKTARTRISPGEEGDDRPKKRGRPSTHIFPITKVHDGDKITIQDPDTGDVSTFTIVKAGRGFKYKSDEINMGAAKSAIKNGTAVSYMSQWGEE